MKVWREHLWVRMVTMLVIGLVFGWLVSEFSFLFSPGTSQREPRRVELVIPAGTAAKIQAGQQPPAIPDNMTFVEGDLLVVKNEDTASHRLGPVWVPPQSSGVLQVGNDSNYSYECSFTKSRLFDLTVDTALTLWTRVQGIISVGLPTGVMLALYTFAMPSKKKDE
jgi:hypothetical protein